MSMRMSKKCYYALRAVFELAQRPVSTPVTVAQIATAQGIPPRFLEGILNELRHAGIAVSHRGNAGGYTLAVPAGKISVADVIEATEGPISVAAAYGKRRREDRYRRGDCAFEELWDTMNGSVNQVCRETSLADLVAKERMSERTPVPDYMI